MIHGDVNHDLTPFVQLDVRGPLGDVSPVKFLFYTGFNGQISLRASTISDLALIYLGSDAVFLADGSRSQVDIYQAVVVWDGQDRNVTVINVEEDPLLGTEMLLDHDVNLGFVNGGPLTIRRRP